MNTKTKIKRKKLIERLEGLNEPSNYIVYKSGAEGIEKIFSKFRKQSHVVILGKIHKGAENFLRKIGLKYAIEITFLDENSSMEQIEGELTNYSVGIYKIEMNRKTENLDELRELTNKYGLKLIVDNHSLTPYIHCPSKIGADIVLHSGIRYIPGYSNVIAGLVISNN